VGSLNEVALVDLKTGKVTAFLPGLSGPHGLVVLPNAEDENSDNAQE